MELVLTDEEVRLLRDVLTNHIGDLRSEITHTERYALRQDLKHDEELLRALVARLTTPASQGIAAG
ncbi:MAG TPA: hypothetical protein VGL23_14910 [Chloroflexota bacterium]|jgi:hypothetical protein